MKILAVEFSTDRRSVAVLADGQPRGVASETGGRAARALGLIEQALAEAKLRREEIECLAVGLGPGSYTGVRAAIALAQGWQLARPVKLLGIRSDEVLAREARAQGWTGAVNVAIDAQRGEFYLSRFEIGGDACRESSPLKIVAADEIRIRLAAGEIVAGPNLPFEDARALFPGAETLGQLASGRTDFVPGEKLEPVYLRETNYLKAPPPLHLPGA
jgi:tRNA threonylcarbamoyl adenosine modification protein YeaZ